MKRLILIGLLLLCLPSVSFAYTMCNGAGNVGTCTGSNPSDCQLRQTFDGSTLCYTGMTSNCDWTWNNASGTSSITFDETTHVLQGTKAMRMLGGTTQSVRASFTAADSKYQAMWFYIGSQNSGSTAIMRFTTSTDTVQCTLSFSGTNHQFYVTNAGGTTQTGATVSSGAGAFYLSLNYIKGTGANAVCEGKYSSDGINWTETLTSNDGTSTTQTPRAYIYGSATVFVSGTWYDDWRLNDTQPHW